MDYESLHGAKLDADTLKQALLAIPAVSKKRLLLIRAVDKLDAHNKNMILEYIQAKNPPAVVVLDSDEQAPKGSFFTKLNSAAKVMRFEEGASPKNVFDMTRALEGRNVAGALKTLKELTDGGEHPLQIMGGIVWFWGKQKGRLPAEKFRKGLIVLQQADLNIKRSRLKPEQAMEVAVTKLGLLMGAGLNV